MRALRAVRILTGFFLLTVPLMPLQLAFLRFSERNARTFPHWYHSQLCRLLGIRFTIEGEVAADKPVLLVAIVPWAPPLLQRADSDIGPALRRRYVTGPVCEATVHRAV